MSRKILGIDIGQSTVKMALVNNGTVEKTAIAWMAEEEMFDGLNGQDGRLSMLLKQMMNESGIRASSAALTLPDEQVLVQSMELPLMEEAQIRQNLITEFRPLLEGEAEDYIYDYIGADPPENDQEDTDRDHLYLIGAAASAAYLNRMREIFKHAGLKLKIAAPQLGAFQSLIRQRGRRPEEGRGEFCFVDLGEKAVKLYLFHKDNFITSRELETGLFHVVECIADSFQVDHQTAREYMVFNDQNCLETEAVRDLFRQIATGLSQALEFFRFSSLGSRLHEIWVCGGGAAIRPLAMELISRLSEVRVRSAASMLPELSPSENRSLYLKAAGIAMYQS